MASKSGALISDPYDDGSVTEDNWLSFGRIRAYQNGDNDPPKPQFSLKGEPMNDEVTKDLLNSKLETIEARMETRQAEMNGKLDRLVDAVTSLSDDVKAAKGDNKFTRWTIAGLSVAMFGVIIALIAIMFTMQGTMTTANGNVVSAFSAGMAAADQQPATPPAK